MADTIPRRLRGPLTPEPPLNHTAHMQPQLTAQYVNAAHAANQQGQPAKAVEFSQLALALNPGMAEAWFNLGIAQARLGQKSAAISALEQARLRCMDSAEGQNSIGLHLLELGALDTAEACLRQAVKLAPNYAYAQSNLGKLFRKRKLLNKALEHVTRAIELAPNEPLLHVNLVGVYLDLKNNQQAEKSARKAIELAPLLPQAWVNLSASLAKQHRSEEAETAACRALELTNQIPEAWEALGAALASQRRFKDSATAFKNSIALNPKSTDTWVSLGTMHGLQSNHAQAEIAYRKALELDPDKTEALRQLGLTLKELRRHEEALACLHKAYEKDPDLEFLLSVKLMAQASVCDWREWTVGVRALEQGIEKNTALTDPLTPIALLDEPRIQRLAAEQFAQRENPAHSGFTASPAKENGKIRIGYFSADFRDHPVGQLLVELLERHDKSRFEIIGYSLSPRSTSPLGLRIANAFDRFIDVSQLSDPELVTAGRQDQLDIAVNLGGYTAGSRNNVFAHRVAPIQVNYLGYAGTMGTEYMDYLITDHVTSPPGSEEWYSEKLARLPNCFMPHDSNQAISRHPFNRSEFGLPEEGFVFCCFNNHHKISPEVFDIWMRLLRNVDRSVLWLTDGPTLLKDNLRREATLRGVAPERLVFARRVDEMADHLARYRLADLFLDTLPYNAHTTACDALWAGVPVLTRSGRCFASRVATSLLHAAGLPELVTDTVDGYKDLALQLANNPSQLQSLRARLAAQRNTCALFDTNRLAQDMESLFVAMYQQHLRGLPPTHINAIDLVAPVN